jgi:hypothetical protein
VAGIHLPAKTNPLFTLVLLGPDTADVSELVGTIHSEAKAQIFEYMNFVETRLHGV